MMTKEIVKVLSDLTQLDIDAVYAYEEALKQIDDQEVYRNIESFRTDHLQHIQDLSKLIEYYGETPPSPTKDLKGYFIEGMTMLRSLTGTKGALSAMESNEKTTNKNYKTALEENPNLPGDVVFLLNKNYEDEKRHLEYIQRTLQKLKSEDSVTL